MAIYDNLPYTNFHELNLSWIIKQIGVTKTRLKEIEEYLDQVEAEYNSIMAQMPDIQELLDATTVTGTNVSFSGAVTSVGGFIGNLTGTASHATSADSATTATTATNANHATSADSATTATTATNATNATNATYATNAGHATTADTANIGVATGAEVFVTTLDATRFPKGASSNMTVRAVVNDSTLAPDNGAWLLFDVSFPSYTNIGNPNGGVFRFAVPLDQNHNGYEPTAERYIKCRAYMYTTADRDTIQSIGMWYNIWTDNDSDV